MADMVRAKIGDDGFLYVKEMDTTQEGTLEADLIFNIDDAGDIVTNYELIEDAYLPEPEGIGLQEPMLVDHENKKLYIKREVVEKNDGDTDWVQPE